MALRSSPPKTSERKTATRRSASSAREAVLDLLREDHKRVKKAFRDFEKLDGEKHGEMGSELVARVCTDLEMHARLEEELFYPGVRESLGEDAMVDEAEVEHLSAQRLIDDLRAMSPEDEKYAATFTVLGEYVKHHVREEEQQMFPRLERAKLDWNGMLDALQSQREALQAEMGGEEAQAIGEPPASTGKRSAVGRRR
jgi:hemerythrin-like domain-containing protein